MRLDKFLKNSRLIKRRTVAKEACEKGLVKINEKVAKPSEDVNIDDIISLKLGDKEIKVRVKDISDVNSKRDAQTLYDRIS
ncbi:MULTISPECIES: RNA-binding S4 domain-containing protein [Peptoniphilus]|jgi:RNA-binding S4 domain-containing protein|uniref:RNA-binding S4 domain-containing protein n=1 Tax=Peptoniphilus TaxID=162289 RepID=UPI000289FC78|nr:MULTISPECIES: RNA-binding S4 domain-containing protein [Peptoniphilus]MBS6610239.1 RNA-binding S4 domain-containing protein [Peptoniphilus harei]MDU1043734.1 RNA-binding S4 domain-containing protein [Peptoniphilus rhinitidis]MDU1955506.1 RNA-binding S4 domain-containing protein [Peptoniphilus lacydonensis]MDU2109495.1 RNA-binding S4 domain-containing protein [Peptoniphilus lacydonensis]MDU2115520.1 RNA-binding S4 domain-containing protein [Peptoniphilus lacydonensis]